MLSGIGELLDLESELVDDLKTAVSEACNNAVIHAYPHEPGILLVELGLDPQELRIAVIDHGAGIRHVAATADRMGVGLAVISALSDRAEFQSVPGGGTAVRMSFRIRSHTPASVAATLRGFESGHGPEGHDPLDADLPEARALPTGDVMFSATPVGLIGDVLGRVSRAVAAGANFSLDRFSDLYLITDELAAQIRASAAADRIGCALTAGAGRLELTLGPFRPGTVSLLTDRQQQAAYSFVRLVDELSVNGDEHGEELHVVVIDRR